MDWQKLLDSPLATWIPILVLVIFVSLVFRKSIAELIERLKVASFKLPGFEGSLEASQQRAQVKHENEIVPPPQDLSLPPKTYRHLIGRQIEIDKVMVALRDPKRRIILLAGLGGIGKTALAREVVERSREEGLVDYVVWSTAKTENFIGERGQKVLSNDFTFGSLVDNIARQVGKEEILRMKPSERLAAIQALLVAESVLIVVDNMDTLPEQEAEELVERLYTILGEGKALCTSRHELRNEQIYTIHLKGLSPEAGRDFLRDEANSRNIEAVATASTPTLNRIYRVTRGAPLAMRLIVGQLSRQPLEEILAALEKVSFEGQDYDFYRYVYQKSWILLDIGSQQALVSMAIFPPVTGGSVEDVRKNVGLESPDFAIVMDRLVRLSLIDKIGSVGRERFALHPLTQYFVNSDIVKKWSSQ